MTDEIKDALEALAEGPSPDEIPDGYEVLCIGSIAGDGDATLRPSDQFWNSKRKAFKKVEDADMPGGTYAGNPARTLYLTIRETDDS